MSNSGIFSLCALALLAGCAQSNSSAELAPAPTAQPTVQAASSGPPPKAMLTPEEAKAQCWMKYESDKRVKNIDARLILVEKCVDETMRGQLVQAPQR
jgi:uncharacterized lipoprotein YajG